MSRALSFSPNRSAELPAPRKAATPTAVDSVRGSASAAAGIASERAAVSIGVGFSGTNGLDATKRAYTFGGNYDPRYGHPGVLVLDGGLGGLGR